MDYIKTLREEFAATHKEAGDVIAAAAKEGRELSAEEKQSNDKRFSRLDAIKGIIDEQSRFAKLALEAGDVQLPQTPPGKAEYEAAVGRNEFAKGNGFDLDAVKEGIRQYARTGETRHLFSVTSGTGSGAYLPKQVLAPVTIRRLNNAYRAVLDAFGVSPIEVPTPISFSLPVADDSANVGLAQSETASATELDPTDASLSIAANTLYSSKQFWYSNTMVLGQSFDVLALTLPMAQKRIDKVQESAWTTAIKAGTVGKTTAAVAGITYAELLDWEHSLPVAYRNDAAFVVSDSLYRALRGLVDDQNRPIMDLDPTNVWQGKIHGKPVIVCDYLDTMAAAHKVGALVSAEALKIVDVTNTRLARYVNVPGKPDQIGFELLTNGDFKFIGNGVRLLATAAS